MVKKLKKVSLCLAMLIGSQARAVSFFCQDQQTEGNFLIVEESPIDNKIAKAPSKVTLIEGSAVSKLSGEFSVTNSAFFTVHQHEFSNNGATTYLTISKDNYDGSCRSRAGCGSGRGSGRGSGPFAGHALYDWTASLNTGTQYKVFNCHKL